MRHEQTFGAHPAIGRIAIDVSRIGSAPDAAGAHEKDATGGAPPGVRPGGAEWKGAVHLYAIRGRARARELHVSGPSLEVTRLLQNPLGHPAPDGERGDIVRISDGLSTIYLTPHEYDEATEQQLRYRLAAEGGRARYGT
jgi:hypothetical protein